MEYFLCGIAFKFLPEFSWCHEVSTETFSRFSPHLNSQTENVCRPARKRNLFQEERVKYLLTGGGTGGHVYPALSLKELLADDDPHAEFLYVGVAGKAEEYILGSLPEEEKIPIMYIHARGLPRAFHAAPLWRFFADLWSGFRESLHIIRTFDPDIIIATGGYVTAPVVLAGRFTHKKIVLHEPNSVPGLVNKVLCRFANRVLVTFPETVASFPRGKAEIAGYPVRRRIQPHTKEAARKQLGIATEARVVFVFGGSSGAESINESLVRNLELILAAENIIIIHGTGRDQTGGNQSYSKTKALLREHFPSPPPEERYIIRDYFHDIDTVYSASDLVVSRAGAGTIMECAAVGVPMILVPKSGLPGDHQMKNAQTVENAGGGVIIKEEIFNDQTVLDGELLMRTIIDMLNDTVKLVEMRKNIRKIVTTDSKERILNAIRQTLETA